MRPKPAPGPPSALPTSTPGHRGTHADPVDTALWQRDRILATVTEAARLLLEGSDFDAAVDTLLANLGGVLGLRGAGLIRIHGAGSGQEPGSWQLTRRWHAPDDEDAAQCFVESGILPATPWVARQRRGEPVRLTIRDHASGVLAETDGVGEDSCLAVPILVDGGWWASLVLRGWPQRDPWAGYVISALETGAACVSAALSRQRLERGRRRELARSNEVVQRSLDVLANEPRLERALGHLLRIFSEELQAPSAALWVRREGSDEYRVALVYQQGRVLEPRDQPQPADWPLATDLRWKAHVTGRRTVLYDAESLAREDHAAAALAARGVRALLGIPLVLGDEVIGSVTVRFQEPRRFAAAELELIQALAHQTTLAMRLRSLSDTALAEARQTAVLSERNRLAGEIHDALAQAFVGVLVQSQAAAESLARGGTHGDYPAYLERISALARDGLAEARRALLALRPPAVEHLGLSRALRALARNATVPGRLRCDVVDTLGSTVLPPPVEHALFRIAQEATQNALRHAHPARLAIVLDREAGRVSLMVEDDGTGFDAPEAQPAAGGLRSMRERAEHCGGTLRVSHAPGGGTRVLAVLPLPPAGEQGA